MSIAWQDVINIAPGDATAFGAIPTASQAALLAVAASQIDPCTWGDLADFGNAYLVAHLAKLGLLRGAGPLTSEKVGDLARSYGTIQGVMGSLGITSYGAEYLRLLRLLPDSIGFVV